MLLELALHQPQGQPGAVDGYIHQLEQIGNAANVILMAVGEHQSLNFVPVALQIGEIWNDQIHPQHLVVGEGEAAVHQKHVAVALVQGDIFADLVKSAQRDNPHCRLAYSAGGGLFPCAGLQLFLAPPAEPQASW